MQSNTLTAGCRALAATTLAVALMGTAVAKERVIQIREASAQTRVLPADASRSILTAASSTRVCETGAKWIRLDFRSLKLQGYDSLVLKSSGGDRYVLQGKHWNNRSFSSRALRGSCVDIQPYFSNRDSGYDVASFSYGTRALAAEPVVVAGAGDICDSTPQDCKETSDLIVQINPSVVFTAGDNAYDSGTLNEYNTLYQPSWGRFKSKTKPTPGNHDYYNGDTTGNGYFDYYNGVGVQNGIAGERGKGYYSWDVGEWHFIALNTMNYASIFGDQLNWLQADLNANTKPCTAVYFHHPLWSTGYYNSNPSMQAAYDKMYAAKVDLLLVGHDHNYQRSKKINASGQPAADGFRQVLVGTGGRNFYSFRTTNTNIAEVGNDKTWGVLKLTLSSTSYVADFVPVASAGTNAFKDNFSGTCNKANTGTTYSVSGNVTNSAGTGIAGVTVSNGSVSATTSSTGAYTLSGLANGSYTLTPALSGYSFSPISRTVAVNGANVTGLSFTGTAVPTTYSVSGTVTNASGAAMSGVSVSNGSATVTTNSSGQYTFSSVSNGSYTLTPSLSGYTFSPASRSATVNGANVTAQNFTGSANSSTVALTKGVPATGLGASTGNSLYFTMVVPVGATNLTFKTSGGSGDAELEVKAGSVPTSAVYDCRSVEPATTESCTISAPQAGTYHVRVWAYETFSGVSLVGNYETSSGNVQTYSNPADSQIIDFKNSWSPITVSGRSGNGNAASKVDVNILHTYIGEVWVDLYAPSGRVYNLRGYVGGSADNINQQYQLNLSGEPLNGTWWLRVYDNGEGDVGKIDSWAITF